MTMVVRQGNLIRVEFGDVPSEDSGVRRTADLGIAHSEACKKRDVLSRLPVRTVEPSVEVVRFMRRHFASLWAVSGLLVEELNDPKNNGYSYCFAELPEETVREAARVLTNIVLRRELSLVRKVRYYLIGRRLVAVHRNDDGMAIEHAARMFTKKLKKRDVEKPWQRKEIQFPWLQQEAVCDLSPEGMNFVQWCKAELRESATCTKLIDLRSLDSVAREEFFRLVADERSRRHIEGNLFIQFATVFPDKAVVAHRGVKRGESVLWDRATSERFQLNLLRRLAR